MKKPKRQPKRKAAKKQARRPRPNRESLKAKSAGATEPTGSEMTYPPYDLHPPAPVVRQQPDVLNSVFISTRCEPD